jgi:uncharacterized Zn finger protein (UPF0148 family)
LCSSCENLRKVQKDAAEAILSHRHDSVTHVETTQNFYQTEDGDSGEELEALRETLETQKDEIEELRKVLASTKLPKEPCPKCGKQNSIDSLECYDCGTVLQKTCPKCGTSTFVTLTRCATCKRSFVELQAEMEALAKTRETEKKNKQAEIDAAAQKAEIEKRNKAERLARISEALDQFIFPSDYLEAADELYTKAKASLRIFLKDYSESAKKAFLAAIEPKTYEVAELKAMVSTLQDLILNRLTDHEILQDIRDQWVKKNSQTKGVKLFISRLSDQLDAVHLAHVNRRIEDEWGKIFGSFNSGLVFNDIPVKSVIATKEMFTLLLCGDSTQTTEALAKELRSFELHRAAKVC